MTRLPDPTPPQPANVLGSRSVVGLEAGREVSRKQQRRRRRRDRIATSLMALIAIGAAAGAGWFGYQFFTENQATERIESDQRRAELDREGSGDDLKRAIEELEETPAWNGPGNPAFGVGNDTPNEDTNADLTADTDG